MFIELSCKFRDVKNGSSVKVHKSHHQVYDTANVKASSCFFWRCRQVACAIPIQFEHSNLLRFVPTPTLHTDHFVDFLATDVVGLVNSVCPFLSLGPGFDSMSPDNIS